MKRVLKVYKKTVSIMEETPVAMMEALRHGKKCFLLESHDKQNGRYTFFGIDPSEVIFSDKNSLIITRSDGGREVQQGNPLELLKTYYDSFEIHSGNEILPFEGGLVGSVAYDFIRYTEEIPDDNPDEIGIDNICLMLADHFIAVDHVAETMTAIVLDEDTEEGKARALKLAGEMLTNARACGAEQKNEWVRDGIITHKTDTLEQYSEKVEKIRHYIREGHIFQTVLSQRWTIQTKQDGFALYKELRELNPSPYLYYFDFGTFEVIGSSPEMLVKQVGNKVSTCPIAGTRPRGRDSEEDAFLKADLLQDEKERAEHVMLVDLARNDMGRIAQFGTVKVSSFMDIQMYSHVMHIVSLVEGKKRGDYHPLDLISSFLPAGTLSGAPKIRAMEIIDELETVHRGLYGGVTGYLDFSGNMDFCITIRTMIKKGENVYLQAGAGIVADSVPEKEYQECCNKVMALAKTLVEEERL